MFLQVTQYLTERKSGLASMVGKVRNFSGFIKESVLD